MNLVPFELRLTGSTADRHRFEAYDGFTAMAGFARVLTLTTHYVETGKIRQKGDFRGRHSVLASVPSEGSMRFPFLAALAENPAVALGVASASTALIALTRHVIRQNVGAESSDDDVMETVLANHPGDVAALVAISESPIRQAHSVIGHGADEIEILGGANLIGQFNYKTDAYVKEDVWDDDEIIRRVTVPSFNVNSGYGSVFDPEIGRVVPIQMHKAILDQYRTTFSWALDEYANGTGKGLEIRFTQILSLDGRPKKYQILGAKPSN